MSLKAVKIGLRAKVTLAILVPLLVVLGIFTSIEYARHRRTVLSNLSLMAGQSSRVIESSLRHAMLESDFGEVQAVLDSIGQSEEFNVVYLLNPAGEIIFAPGGVNVGQQLNNSHADCQPCHKLTADARPQSVIVELEGQGRVFRSMQPIENKPECMECHDPNQRLLGLLLTDISVAPMEAALAADLRENMLWWLVTIGASVVVVNIVLNRFVMRRLEKLAAAVVGLGQGAATPIVHDNQPDEIGRLAGAFNTMAQQVRAREQDNQDLTERLQQQSTQRGELYRRVLSIQEDERKRVARELHDELGQLLTGLAYQTEAIERFVTDDPDRAQQQARVVRSLVAETTQQMYELIFDLRPSALDDLGLVPALRAYAERLFEGRDIQFEIRSDHLSRMPPQIETTLYRIYQEGLNNITRHAQASQVRITLEQDNNVFLGKILDNGIGFEPASISMTGLDEHGLGLLGMQERIAQCGGTIDIRSRPGCGTRIIVCIPLKENGCV
jgi:signal transduction histidine kinase